jgi:hypothetical protein
MARQHFDSTIVKVTKKGDTVLSTYLDAGEKIAGPNRDPGLVSDETATEQPTLTSDDANVNTKPGSLKTEDVNPGDNKRPADDASSNQK